MSIIVLHSSSSSWSERGLIYRVIHRLDDSVMSLDKIHHLCLVLSAIGGNLSIVSQRSLPLQPPSLP